MKNAFRVLIGFVCLTCALGQPSQCSEECARFLLDNPDGPQVLKLFKELPMPDEPGTRKSQMEIDGERYELSPPKQSVVENALSKGVPEDLMRKMFDHAGISPADSGKVAPETTTSASASRQLRSNESTDLPLYTTAETLSSTTTQPAESIPSTPSSTESVLSTPSSTESVLSTPSSTEFASSTPPSSPITPPSPASSTPGVVSTTTENDGPASPEGSDVPPLQSTPPVEQSPEGPPEETFSPPRYQISTRENGDLVLSINGTELKMPEELPKLNQIVKNPQLLTKIIDDLRSVGVPIKNRGNQVSLDYDAQSDSEEPIYLQIFTSNGRPFKVVIKNKEDRYQLPGDESAFNKLLATQPQIAYQILSLLAAHGITARIDQSHNFGIPDLLPQDQPPLLPPVIHRPVVSRNRVPSTRTPPGIRVGENQFSFPRDWERLREQVERATVPAAKVQRALEEGNIDCPPQVFLIIYQNMLQDFDNKMEVVRQENEIGMNLGSRYYPLPQEAENVAFMMRNDLLACEFLRDSLMRVGVESSRDNGGLEVSLPQRGGSFFMSNLPSFRLFEYKVVPNKDGSIKIICGPDNYTLPEDQNSLQRAMEQREVLPLEVVDAMKRSGLPARMDFLTQNLELQNGPNTLRFPVKRRAGPSTNVKLYSQGRPGNMSFLVEVDDLQLSLPRDIRKLNTLILNERLDPLRLVELFKQRTYVPYYFDTEKGRHVIVIDGEPLEFAHSSRLNYQGSSSSGPSGAAAHRRQ